MHITDNIWVQDIHTAIERCWFNIHVDLHKYNLIDKTYNNKDVFDIITHHVVLDICEESVACLRNGGKLVLYLNTKFKLKSSEIIPYSSDCSKMISRLEKLIPKLIPAYIIKRPYVLYGDGFVQKYSNREVEAVEEVDKLQHKIDRNTFKPFNLNKIINYLEQRNLKYLSTQYFQQVSNKLLAANK